MIRSSRFVGWWRVGVTDVMTIHILSGVIVEQVKVVEEQDEDAISSRTYTRRVRWSKERKKDREVDNRVTKNRLPVEIRPKRIL